MNATTTSTHEGHGGHRVADIQKHVRVYMVVFATLAFLTIVTVLVSYMKLPLAQAIVVALAIATVKASLVAAYFMHLISEKRLIFWVLFICAVFFAVLMALPSLTTFEKGVM